MQRNDLPSSEAELPQAPMPQRPRGSLRSGMKGLRALFHEEDDDEEEETDDEEEFARRRVTSRVRPPGSSAAQGSSGKRDEGQGASTKDLKEVLMQGLAEGQTPSDLVPIMMMSMLLDKDKKEKRGKHRGRDSKDLSLFGGSDSEDSAGEEAFQGKGMRAVATLRKLHEQIRRRPRKICEIFEHEVIQEMGVIKGQAWTLKDYVKKQPWGKFKGIYRCALMDVEVYEQLRNGEPQIAAAQVVQNLKAKLQSVLQGGDWSTAWLLTGLPDPLAKREWAGSKEEMAIISGYVDALHRLKKRVKDSQTAAEDDEGEGQAGHSRK